jgi:Glyoxalase/Bleomycin resistance protein/Dioxygenase superfamily
MKRFHIHIAVEDLNRNIQHYSTLFGAKPAVVKADYAKWMLDDPRINFAISQRGAVAGLNHLGLQVDSAEELAEVRERLQSLQTSVVEQKDAACCYAKSDKYWVNDPQGIAWETFHTLDAIPVFGGDDAPEQRETGCCVPLVEIESHSPCCVPTETKPSTTGGCC